MPEWHIFSLFIWYRIDFTSSFPLLLWLYIHSLIYLVNMENNVPFVNLTFYEIKCTNLALLKNEYIIKDIDSCILFLNDIWYRREDLSMHIAICDGTASDQEFIAEIPKEYASRNSIHLDLTAYDSGANLLYDTENGCRPNTIFLIFMFCTAMRLTAIPTVRILPRRFMVPKAADPLSR